MVNSVSTGGSGQNAILVQKKEQEFGIVAQDVAYHAYKGIEEFKGKDCPDIRAVTGGYSYAMNLIVLDNSPIKSYRDVVGKKVCATGGAAVFGGVLQNEKAETYLRLSQQDRVNMQRSICEF